MDPALRRSLLEDQLKLMDAAAGVLRESHERVSSILQGGDSPEKRELTPGERESCEALTSRFARLCDFLFQRVFRTLDTIELQDEGTGLDRLNRMEKRGLIPSAAQWRSLRDLRNAIAHDYLIESSDEVLLQAHSRAGELLDAVARIRTYVADKGYLQ